MKRLKTHHYETTTKYNINKILSANTPQQLINALTNCDQETFSKIEMLFILQRLQELQRSQLADPYPYIS